jgi:hypothetical protein
MSWIVLSPCCVFTCFWWILRLSAWPSQSAIFSLPADPLFLYKEWKRAQADSTSLKVLLPHKHTPGATTTVSTLRNVEVECDGSFFGVELLVLAIFRFAWQSQTITSAAELVTLLCAHSFPRYPVAPSTNFSSSANFVHFFRDTGSSQAHITLWSNVGFELPHLTM